MRSGPPEHHLPPAQDVGVSPGPRVPSPLDVMGTHFLCCPLCCHHPQCELALSQPAQSSHSCTPSLCPPPPPVPQHPTVRSTGSRGCPSCTGWQPLQNTFPGVGGAPVCCRHRTPLPSWGSRLMAQPRGSAGPPRPRAVATQQGPSCQARGVGELEQRSLCAQAPEPALYDLQALPSLQPGSGESYSLRPAWGRGGLPPRSLAPCVCGGGVPARGSPRWGGMGQDAGDHPAPLGGRHPFNGANKGAPPS